MVSLLRRHREGLGRVSLSFSIESSGLNAKLHGGAIWLPWP